MTVVSMRQLLEAGVHFGHQTRRWNPKMRRFIFDERNGIYIIDIQQTIAMLEKAYYFVRDTVAKGGSVLFVGTKKQAQEAVEVQAARVGMPYVSFRWLGGMLTNFETIKTRLKRLEELEKMAADGTLELLPKKEALQLDREREKLERNLGGIRTMTKVPAAVWVVDTVKEHIAVKESNRLGIPVVAVVDTNCDPDVIDYVIPGNDDAIRSGALLTRIIADACADGHALRASRSEDEVVAEQAAAAAAAAVKPARREVGPDEEPLAEWEIALQREEAARQAAQAGASAAEGEEQAPAGADVEPEPSADVPADADANAEPEPEPPAAAPTEADANAKPEPEPEPSAGVSADADAKPEPPADAQPEEPSGEAESQSGSA